VRPPDRMPADARALARFHLIDLRERLTRRLTPPASFDAYTQAHLMDARERIDMALKAEYQIDPSAAAATPIGGAPARD
ncbi:MAG TPA: hypothetical protein VEL74_17360, partial [Thermoanaerobaculia bacterium]|nr:hypothetical protein [Thermoanaerobaculia bacterium]